MARHRAAPTPRPRPRRRGRSRASRARRPVAAGATAAVVTALLVGGGVLGSSPGGADAVSADVATAAEGAPDEAAYRAPVAGRAEPVVDREVDGEATRGTALPRATRTAGDLPPRSGTGRRVVFSEGRQRVWLVAADGEVRRTYLVSGSLHDNLDPGRYEVYSRSRHAWGIDDSGTMEYFVRFTRGENAAIGFHDIPVHRGRPVQAPADLGTPQSHGCIRQRRSDAVALWRFASVGTRVVVTP